MEDKWQSHCNYVIFVVVIVFTYIMHMWLIIVLLRVVAFNPS